MAKPTDPENDEQIERAADIIGALADTRATDLRAEDEHPDDTISAPVADELARINTTLGDAVIRIERLEANTLGHKITVVNGSISIWKGKFHWACNRCHSTGAEADRRSAEQVLKLPCAGHGGPKA